VYKHSITTLTKCFIFNISVLKQVTFKIIYICFSVTARILLFNHYKITLEDTIFPKTYSRQHKVATLFLMDFGMHEISNTRIGFIGITRRRIQIGFDTFQNPSINKNVALRCTHLRSAFYFYYFFINLI